MGECEAKKVKLDGYYTMCVSPLKQQIIRSRAQDITMVLSYKRAHSFPVKHHPGECCHNILGIITCGVFFLPWCCQS